MSIRLMAAAWELDIPSTEKMVLLCLADYSNDAGACWPSVPTIARKCSKSHRTVQAAIQWLRSEGFCSWDETPGKPHRFSLDPRKICTPAESAPPQKLQPTPAEVAPKPLRTINASEAKASSARRATFPPPVGVPDEVWSDYLALRISKRARMSPTAYSRQLSQLKELEDAGYPPGEIVALSVERGWTGFFEPKTDRDGRRNGRAGENHGDRNLAAAELAFGPASEWTDRKPF